MTDYKGNSYKEKQAKSQEQTKHIEKVINGTAVTKKKTLGKRIAESEITDKVITRAKEEGRSIISDILCMAIEMIFGRGNRSGNRTASGYTAYNAVYRNVNSQPPISSNMRSYRGNYSCEEVILDNRRDAEAVLDNLYSLLNQYQVVAVADLYELVGIPSNYIDNNYGWYDLTGSNVLRASNGGYLIHLPRVTQLN